MGNEYTKQQLKKWLDSAVYRAKNPDPIEKLRQEIKQERHEKAKKIKARLGL